MDATEGISVRRDAGGLTVRAVAQKAGIGIGNLQYYLPIRAKLLDAVFNRRSSATTRSPARLLARPRYQPDQALFWHLWAINARDQAARETMPKIYGELTNSSPGSCGA